MAYITNDGSRLIERARTEGKSLVFGSVRMNTIYKSDPTSLVQQTDEWFGESHGSVVGCISYVSVDEGSKVCDSKLAVQCNDNGESWKSLGIYARLDGEEDEVLFACESIENGEYKDVTIVELPVTLAGVVEDFGLSEGSGGGGGGVPANMMTTDTDQIGMSGMKQWLYKSFDGGVPIDNPNIGDRRTLSFVSIGRYDGNPQEDLIGVSSFPQYYNGSEWLSGNGSLASLTARGGLRLNSGDTYDDVEHVFHTGESLTITPNDVVYTNQIQETFIATWSSIINAANSGSGGGGGVPANVMTTNTVQTGLSGTKTWTWENYISDLGSLDNPREGDKRVHESFSIDNITEGGHVPLSIDSNISQYTSKDGWLATESRHLSITSNAVYFNDSFASWSDIINAAKVEPGFDHAPIRQREDGSIEIGGVLITPNSEIQIGTYAILVIDSNSKIASVRSTGGRVLDVSVAVFGSGSVHRVNGIVNDTAGLSFDAPITPAEGQELYIHWARYA